ncbi:DUF998 domain-containing protein [Arthrobacter sp. H14-L1]|uniref:DUF998 domain-containing protein n=1 Tax=Arthrobacter sp. H14-L1 TaxID=2996697 RepID=UPI00226ECCBE|nr:DUF998 domain-containing protein [Arthrobacter sp. H14-L1]MCY0903847.1 DUF998 domain-containing protein [Arthrobacter sp. H14-L1]
MIYTGVDVLLQRLPPHYSAIRDAESNLAVGPYGWVMNLNFLGRAVTTFAVARAVLGTGPASRRRTTGATLLGIGGVSSGVLAFFPTDILTDIPGPLPSADAAGTDAAGASVAVQAATATPGGMVHLIVAGAGFVSALAGICLLTQWLRSYPPLRPISRAATGFAAVGAVGLVSLGLSSRLFPRFLGLAERVALAGILGWAFSVSAGIRSLSRTR